MAERTDTTERPDGTKRVRMIIDTEEIIPRAVDMRKAKMPRGTTKSDVVNGILRKALAREIAELERYASEGPEEDPAPRSRKRP